MKHTDFYNIIQDIKHKEQQELKKALEAHGGSYSWWDEDKEGFIDGEYPIIAANICGCLPGPIDLEVMKVYVENNYLTIIGQNKETGETIEIDPYDAFAGHISYVIELIPATESVDDVTQNQEYFPITSVSREDLTNRGFSAHDIDDSVMERLAGKMSDAYLDNGYWVDLPIIAEALGIPYIHDIWFANLDFIALEKLTRLNQFDFSSEDGSQAFVDACEQWWDRLTILEKKDYYENYS